MRDYSFKKIVKFLKLFNILFFFAFLENYSSDNEEYIKLSQEIY